MNLSDTGSINRTQTTSSLSTTHTTSEQTSSSCCWTRHTWRKIITGVGCTTNLAAIITTIYGAAVKDTLITYIGAGSGLGFSVAWLFADVAFYQCRKDPLSSVESSDKEEELRPETV